MGRQSEELISRAFMIDQWLGVLPASRLAGALSVVLSAATFSAVRWYRGLTGLISNSVAGALCGALYLIRRRTLASNIVAHSLAALSA
jgi:hypothetical protein